MPWNVIPAETQGELQWQYEAPNADPGGRAVAAKPAQVFFIATEVEAGLASASEATATASRTAAHKGGTSTLPKQLQVVAPLKARKSEVAPNVAKHPIAAFRATF